MKKLSLQVLAIILFSNTLFAQSGVVEKTLHSDILQREVNFSVFLPGGYSPAKTYPVIFYLHSFGSDHHEAEGLAGQVKSLTESKQFSESIIIAPDAGISWYIDDYAGKFRYATFFMNEFLPAMQKQFSLSTLPEKRAIMGMSMGGFGALRFAMLSPDQFGICVSLMGAINTKDQIRDDKYYDIFLKDIYGKDLKGEARVNDWFIKNNPLYILESRDVKLMSKIKWYIQCCDQDFHSLPNAKLHIAMREREIPHQYRVNSGDHTGECFEGALPDAIRFIGQAFGKTK